MQGSFTSISQFRQLNYQQGYHWFDKSTMSFFGTRLHTDIYGGCVFVTSDKTFEGVRKYSVRVGMDDGTINSYAFVEYDTRSEAHREAKWLGKALASGDAIYDTNQHKFVRTDIFTPSK
tara:strand:- start:599 stop:955 length:357 start_codon:yes stop_codon:yes gene_type:complete